MNSREAGLKHTVPTLLEPQDLKLPEERSNPSPGTATAWNTSHHVSRQDILDPWAPDQNSTRLSPDARRASSGRARLDDEVSIHTRRDRGYEAAARRLKKETPDSSVPPDFAKAEDNLVGIGSIFHHQGQHRSTSGSSHIEVMADSVETSLVAYAGKSGAAKWLPVNKLLEIIHEEDVHLALSEACKGRGLAEPILQEYAAKVCGLLSYIDRAGQPTSLLGSRSMFAILVMVNKVDEIIYFVDQGFTDEDLPLVPYGENNFPAYPGGLNPGELQCFELGKTWDRLQWRDPSFAVKELHSSNDSFDKKHEHNFKQEVRGWAKSAGVSEHPHLTRLLATWSQDGKWSLLFPWAQGNLNGFWEKMSTPKRSPRLAQWVSKQCLGLAEGLRRIHKSRSDPKRQWGIHGDIKPQNILWFDDPNDDQGILAISDFGFTRFHGEETRSNALPVGLSPTYRAPEYDTINKISRAADIWALSCVYLEFVTWYLKGHDGVREFVRRRIEDDRGEAPIKSDKFFNFTQPHADKRDIDVEVKQSVIKWIAELRQTPQCNQYFKELLGLIQDKLFCLEPNAREKCDTLVLQLRKLSGAIDDDEAMALSDDCRNIVPEIPIVAQTNLKGWIIHKTMQTAAMPR
ncbi:hypothetical protein CTA2_4697 [Colletotrichum tanaceti]|nr:hypothetical protein CTA2_4697 [Colletotrichum tanaceti]